MHRPIQKLRGVVLKQVGLQGGTMAKDFDEVAEDIRAHLEQNKQRLASTHVKTVMNALYDNGYVIIRYDEE